MDKRRFLSRDKLQSLVDILGRAGFRVRAPVVADGTLQIRDIGKVEELPRGIADIQAPGSYRLQPADSQRCFAWANGPQALKPETFAPRETLWRVRRDEAAGLAFDNSAEAPDTGGVAIIGVRACDLAALKLQDRHFLGDHADPRYAARRRRLFLVAVHCSHPAQTCFCVSTGDGPDCRDGYDLVLNELDDGFLVDAGSAAGDRILAQLPLKAARDAQRLQADGEIADAARRQSRSLPAGNLRDTLFDRLHHPRWEAVAGRCLSCGNCTSVCPTCFCHAERDVAELGGEQSSHVREWDSCFTEGHSYLHGFVVRPQTTQRYRQWLTHKLGSWHDQYGRSGCVGCGRCITWCPVGIDITEEAHAICDGDRIGRGGIT